MLRNKKNVLKYTHMGIAVEALSMLLILAVLCITAAMYPDAPDTVPKSYGFFGAVSEWGERSAALLHPILAIYVYLIVTGFGLIARRAARNGDPRSVLSAVLMTLMCMKTIWLFYEVIRTYSVMQALGLPVWAGFILPAGLGLSAVIGAFKILTYHRAGKVQVLDACPPQ